MNHKTNLGISNSKHKCDSGLSPLGSNDSGLNPFFYVFEYEILLHKEDQQSSP